MNDDLVLTGADLEKPEEPIQLPTQPRGETPSEFVGRTVSPFVQAGNDFIVQAETEEARMRDDVLGNLSNFNNETPDFAGEFSSQLKRFGTPEAVTELRDVQTQLNGLNTEFDVTNTKIEDGNSITQSQREVTQNERERAVRTAGLAARAHLLQGNIETAQSIARDTVNFAFQDKAQELQILRSQLDALNPIVREQNAQLIANRERELDAADAQLENLKAAVEGAITSGGASAQEIDQLTGNRLSDDEKLSLAQEIQGRVASEDRGLDRALQSEQLRGAQLSNAVQEAKLAEADQNVTEGTWTIEQAEAVTDMSAQLLKEPQYKEMFEIKQGYDTANTGYEEDSGFGDVAMVNGYQRMIDPGAAVREGDIVVLEEAAAKVQQLLGIKGKITDGDKFTDDVREKLNNAVQAQYATRVASFEEGTKARYQDLIERHPTLAGVVSYDDIGMSFSTGANTVFGVVAEADEGISIDGSITFNLPK